MATRYYTLHPIKSADKESGEMLAAVHRDGHGFLLGECAEIESLATALTRYLGRGKHDGEIDEMDERLGWTHIAIAEAVALAGDVGTPVAAPTIRAAAARGEIRGAHLAGKTWRFPRARFLGWLRRAPHTRGRSAST